MVKINDETGQSERDDPTYEPRYFYLMGAIGCMVFSSADTYITINRRDEEEKTKLSLDLTSETPMVRWTYRF
jgi:hypothetical protein